MIIHTPEILFYILLTFHLFLVLKTALPVLTYTGPDSLPDQATPSFSVIVCAHNEHDNLRRLVSALLSQIYPEFEVILVLDRCNDESAASLMQIQHPRLQVITITETAAGFSGKKYALTQGIARARSEWLLFTDADCLPSSVFWITSFAAHISPTTDLILGLSPYRVESTAVSELTTYETFQTALLYTSATLYGKPYMGVGRNICYRKSAFHRVNGFAPYESIVGGDDDLMVQKIAADNNTVMNIQKESLTYSLPKRTWTEYRQQKRRHLSVGRHYKPRHQTSHAIRMTIHAFLWLSFLSLIGSFTAPIRIFVVFGVLLLMKGFLFYRISKKTGVTFHWKYFPAWDFVYAILIPLIGFRALVDRNIKWK